MCRPPILTSRNIGLAENALRALLNKALQHTGLDYHRWVALKLVADGQWPIPVATLIGQLKDFLKMDEAGALAAINDLRAEGLVDTAIGSRRRCAAGHCTSGCVMRRERSRGGFTRGSILTISPRRIGSSR